MATVWPSPAFDLDRPTALGGKDRRMLPLLTTRDAAFSEAAVPRVRVARALRIADSTNNSAAGLPTCVTH